MSPFRSLLFSPYSSLSLSLSTYTQQSPQHGLSFSSLFFFLLSALGKTYAHGFTRALSSRWLDDKHSQLRHFSTMLLSSPHCHESKAGARLRYGHPGPWRWKEREGYIQAGKPDRLARAKRSGLVVFSSENVTLSFLHNFGS